MSRSAKHIKSWAMVYGPDPQHPSNKANRFMACVKIGVTSGRRSGQECGFGPTPRKAISRALREIARRLDKRKGAFNYRGF